LWSSAGSVGSQFFCFLPTKAHFSSNWTSRVRGGKSHEFVVAVESVLSGHPSQSCDGIAVDADQPGGRSDAPAFEEVGQDVVGLLGWEVGVEQGRALAFGEAGLAGVAVEQAELILFAVAGADREVSGVALAVARAVGVLAAEACEVVHGSDRIERVGPEAVMGCK
jgi:hypothetical protein